MRLLGTLQTLAEPCVGRRSGAPAARGAAPEEGRHSLRNKENFAILTSLNRRCPGSVRVRLSDAAAPLEMVAAARRAAARSSTDTLVSARGKTRAVSLWDELATWDPGD